jgi:phenylpropionate dioxygenase-like ring-hydroxylating dioxygenase large terminal subunit
MTRSGRPPEGSWTEHYPELGTGPISFADSTSEEFYELERQAVFKRAWLNVARVEELPRTGSYVTKEIEVSRASVILVKGRDDRIRAFYNVCRHRGNKLVWNDFPHEEARGICRGFTCKYHGWRYGLDGALTFVQQRRNSSTSTRPTTDCVPCTATCGTASFSSTSTPSRARPCESSWAR